MMRWLKLLGPLQWLIMFMAAGGLLVFVNAAHVTTSDVPAVAGRLEGGVASAVLRAGTDVGAGTLNALSGVSSQVSHSGLPATLTRPSSVGGQAKAGSDQGPVLPPAVVVVQPPAYTVLPGGQLSVSVQVHNPNAQSVTVGLGMSLVPRDGRPIFSDPRHDLVAVTLPAGDSVLHRLFDVPGGTPAGRYGVWLALYDDSFPHHPVDRVYADLGMYGYQVAVE